MSRTFEALKQAEAERERREVRQNGHHNGSSGLHRLRSLLRREKKTPQAVTDPDEQKSAARQPIVLTEPEDETQGGRNMAGQEKKDNVQLSSPSPTNGETDKDDSRLSVLRKGLTIRGEIHGPRGLCIQGRVDGEVSVNGEVIVEPGAEVQATITATQIIVGGKVTGGLTATGKVEILATGEVLGDIRGKTLLVHEDATLAGEVQVGTALEAETDTLSLPEQTPSLSVENGSGAAVPTDALTPTSHT